MIGQCGGCGRSLTVAVPEDQIAQTSCECGFINLFGRDVTILPLREELELLTDATTVKELLSDSEDPGYCREVLERAFDLYLKGARTAVDSEPHAACAARWSALVEFDRVSRRFRAGANSAFINVIAARGAVQILEGCLFELPGVLDADSLKVTSPRLRRFVDRYSPFAKSATMLAPLVDNLSRGLMTATIRGGRYEVRKTSLHSRFQEWLLNRNRLERSAQLTLSDEELISTAGAKAQELWLGFSPAIGRTLFAARHRLLKELADHREETVYAIRSSRCQSDFATLFDWLKLVRERACRFETPFYWDLGGVNETEDSWEVVRRLGSRNWLNYYPVLDAMVMGEPGFLVSAEALTYALANLESLKNGLLQRITNALKGDPAADASLRNRVNQLRVATNRRFEELAADRGKQLGFEVATSLDRVDGRLFEGGEIDLLWVAKIDRRIVLVLGEVKDFDLALHRLGSDIKLHDKIASAERQIERKAETVRRTWRSLLQLISGGRITSEGEPALLAKMLLTSNYVPPYLPSRYPALTLYELDRFVEDVRRWPENFPPRFVHHAVELLT